MVRLLFRAATDFWCQRYLRLSGRASRVLRLVYYYARCYAEDSEAFGVRLAKDQLHKDVPGRALGIIGFRCRLGD